MLFRSEDAIVENRRGFAEAAAAGSSPLDALRIAGVNALRDAHGDNGCIELDLIIAASRNGGELTELYRRVHGDIVATLAGMVRAAQASHEIGAQLDPDLLARVLLGMVNGLRLEMIDPETDLDPERAIDLIGTLLQATA